MVILNPTTARLGGMLLEGVTLVVVDRSASREAVEWSDQGPHVVFADMPEQRVTIRVVQDVPRGGITVPRPGEAAELSLVTQGEGDDHSRVRVWASVVVLRVTHALKESGLTRTIEMIAVSGDGASDPVGVGAAENEA